MAPFTGQTDANPIFLETVSGMHVPASVVARVATFSEVGSSVTTFDGARIAGGITSYVTNFDTNENPISEGGVWSNTGLDWSAVQIVGGRAFGTQTGPLAYDDSFAILNGAFAADQQCSAVVYRNPSLIGVDHEVELLLRATVSAHSAKFYECDFAHHGGLWVVKWLGPLAQAVGDGGFIQIANFSGGFIPLVDGDVLKAQIVGNTISVWVNATLKGTVTDTVGLSGTAPYTTGNPGIGFFTIDGGGASPNTDLGFTSFTAGVATSGSTLIDGQNASVNISNTLSATTTIFDDCSGAADLSNLWNYTWHAPTTGQWVEKRRVPTSADIPTATVALPHANNLTQYICGCANAATADAYSYDVIVGHTYTRPAYPYYTFWSWYARLDPGWVHQSNDHNLKFFAFGGGAQPYPMPNNWYASYQAAPPQDLNYPGSFWNNTDDVTDGGWNDDSTLTGLYTGVGKSFMNSSANPTAVWMYRETWIKFTNASDGYIKSYTSSPGSRTLKQVFNYTGITDPYAGTARCEAYGGYAREHAMPTQWMYWADVMYDRHTTDDTQIVFTDANVYANSSRFAFQPRVSRTSSAITFKFRKGSLLTGNAYGWARSIKANTTTALGTFTVA